MKPESAVLAAVCALLVGSAPHSAPEAVGSAAPPAASQDRRAAGPATANLAAWVSDLRAANRRDGVIGGRSAGNLWIEVDRLKREGRNMRRIEWQVSEIEESLRRGSADATARRHRLNNLSYELEALKRRAR